MTGSGHIGGFRVKIKKRAATTVKTPRAGQGSWNLINSKTIVVQGGYGFIATSRHQESSSKEKEGVWKVPPRTRRRRRNVGVV